MKVLDPAQRVVRRIGKVWRKAGVVGDHISFGARILLAVGMYRVDVGDLDGAIRVMARAASRAPESRAVRFSLASALYRARRHLEASRLLLSIVRDASLPRASALLALVLGELGLVGEAERHAREGVSAAPSDAFVVQALAKVLAWQMRYGDAVALIEGFLSSGKHDKAMASWLPYYVTLQPDADPESAARASALVAASLFPGAVAVPARPPRQRRARPRIGYVSGDLRKHPVAQFLEPLLREHDRSEFDVHIYDNTASPDHVNARLRAMGHQWRTIVGHDDAATVRLIAADGIDILIDLSGHTQGHRLGVFANRSAQVQATWLGFPASTGLATMDFRVVDAYTVPHDSEFPGAERPLRLPVVFACFQPQDSPAKPVTAIGGATFGSVHKFEKLNHEVVSTWSRILAAEPTARLLIARDDFDPMVAKWVLGEFRARGIAAERIEIRRLNRGGGDLDDALAAIDVLLDAFPWSGHATCCYALAAGVPVVTLAGNTHAGRMVASVLAAVGFEGSIATTRDQYVQLALTAAEQVEALRAQRLERAALFRQSRACDGAAFARDFEAAFRCVLGS